MKGIILAGGTGSRLRPLTRVTNKHLLPIYDKPMIYYPINTLITAGIKDILIICGKESAGHFLELLGSGKEFNATFTYRIQDESDGIAGAIKLAEDFVNGESFAVILGDNIFDDDFSESVKNFKTGAFIFAKMVKDPQRFGVVEFGKGHKVISIEEKPKKPKSHFAQTGLYFYDNQAFEFIRTLKPSKRGELEVTDLNNFYLKEQELRCELVKGFWSDAGTFDSLNISNNFIRRKYEKNKNT